MIPIDADALENKILKRGAYKICTDDVVAMIADAPTVDAVPVTHGEWIWDDTKCIYRCSICNSPKVRENMDREAIKEQRFCYNCGCRMDGKENG